MNHHRFNDGDEAMISGSTYTVHDLAYKPASYWLPKKETPDERMRRIAQDVMDRCFYVPPKG